MMSNKYSTAEKLRRLEKRLLQNEWDMEPWALLIREITSMSNMDVARTYYEKLVAQFPTCGRYWKIYIEHEMKYKHYEKVEKLFQRCLIKVVNIELWKCYLNYVNVTKVNMPSFNEKMAQAYDFALDKIGQDYTAYSIWNDYINFLRGVEANGSYAQNQRVTAVRRVFQKGIMNPMMNIEMLWKEYHAFEESINPLMSKKILDEHIREYSAARKVAKECDAMMRGINRNAPPLPVSTAPENLTQKRLWKKFINWEMNNPMRTEDQQVRGAPILELLNSRVNFSDEFQHQPLGLQRAFFSPHRTLLGGRPYSWGGDIETSHFNPSHCDEPNNALFSKLLITKRVIFTFELALLVLCHHPDIWYSTAMFLEGQAKILLEKGDMNNSKSIFDDVTSIYERSISGVLSKCQLLYFAFADFEESQNKLAKAHQIYQSFIAIEDVNPTLAYIQHMRFARRAEGIKSARTVFKKAREDSRCTYQVYVAAAMMEYYCSKDINISIKVFELGLKKYGDVPEYVHSYIVFSSSLNEDNNTRVLFERVLTSSGNLKPESTGDIWSRFMEFETTCGDLSSILKVEKRRKETFKEEFEDRDAVLLIDRFKYGNLYPCSPDILQYLNYKDRRSGGAISNASNPGCGLNPYTAIAQYPRPDFSQMIPYKPKQNVPPGMYRVPGGVFPFPETVYHVLKKLPPPSCFHGPFVFVDALMNRFSAAVLPDDMPGKMDQSLATALATKIREKLDETSQDGGVITLKLKKRDVDTADLSDDEDLRMPPQNDLYRLRQQKRVR